jgi:hypothetical protein
MMSAAVPHHAAGGGIDDILDVVYLPRAPWASRVFSNIVTEGPNVPKQLTNNDSACEEELINHPLVFLQEDIPNQVTTWFHPVKGEYREEV